MADVFAFALLLTPEAANKRAAVLVIAKGVGWNKAKKHTEQNIAIVVDSGVLDAERSSGYGG